MFIVSDDKFTDLITGNVYQRRPIIVNNWEATYFDFNEEKLFPWSRSQVLFVKPERDGKSDFIEIFMIPEAEKNERQVTFTWRSFLFYTSINVMAF